MMSAMTSGDILSWTSEISSFTSCSVSLTRYLAVTSHGSRMEIATCCPRATATAAASDPGPAAGCGSSAAAAAAAAGSAMAAASVGDGMAAGSAEWMGVVMLAVVVGRSSSSVLSWALMASPLSSARMDESGPWGDETSARGAEGW
jgi:hypothetical protein